MKFIVWVSRSSEIQLDCDSQEEAIEIMKSRMQDGEVDEHIKCYCAEEPEESEDGP